MIFAETERLILRTLEKEDLPRLVKLLDVWDVVRWLTVVPFPYTMRDAETFYADVQPSYANGTPELFIVALKTDNLLIGGIGLHPPRTPDPLDGEIEVGYWLGKDFWRQGLMTEAVQAIVDIGFTRPTTRAIGATTAPSNNASRCVLRKAGLRDMGIMPRPYRALRGSDEVVRWLLTREQYEQEKRQ